MKGLTLYPMKKVEIIVRGEDLSFVLDLLERANVSGYTIVHNLSGKGSHGFHEGHLLFNEEDTLAMVVSVMPEEKARSILEGFAPFLNKHSGVVFVSDTMVSRIEKFKR
ncbi:P-II family nitrogen regulator [Marinithermus hydrothermalis]|uniref:Nitrogen regulatory protein P-II n=1 Tax=Marinithermus hydrothermalis (strain DSM 14884 / JCM 11576 / T1) TaxID=869210 RepID=F2NMW1_MARHT|nr:P-II family nitrogen regulator [Marinithermus hydrothermalis]AEB12700.1 nitrogen regulatory protein P-II [Marinithermus hydrothermalis DSM 14884]